MFMASPPSLVASRKCCAYSLWVCSSCGRCRETSSKACRTAPIPSVMISDNPGGGRGRGEGLYGSDSGRGRPRTDHRPQQHNTVTRGRVRLLRRRRKERIRDGWVVRGYTMKSSSNVNLTHRHGSRTSMRPKTLSNRESCCYRCACRYNSWVVCTSAAVALALQQYTEASSRRTNITARVGCVVQ